MEIGLLSMNVVKSIVRIPIQGGNWALSNERCEKHCKILNREQYDKQIDKSAARFRVALVINVNIIQYMVITILDVLC